MTRHRPHVSADKDRWMVSWADLLTLLFASVVVLYASAARNGFPAAHSKSAAKAPAVVSARQVSDKATPGKDDLARSYRRLRDSLHNEIGEGKLQVSLETRGVVVSLEDQSFFTSGSDEIPPSALKSIAAVASVIGELPNNIRLEGHTDAVPIHNMRFRDNWSLSAARSAAVISLLESRFDIPGARLSIAAYADNRPVAANESAEGRTRNRRVDIVILSQSQGNI
jgi:chemotaxis protein MotB